MPSKFKWISSGLLAPVAPNVYKPPGKPPIKRKKDANESRNPYKVSRENKLIMCKRCQRERHNARRCKANVTNEIVRQHGRRGKECRKLNQ